MRPAVRRPDNRPVQPTGWTQRGVLMGSLAATDTGWTPRAYHGRPTRRVQVLPASWNIAISTFSSSAREQGYRAQVLNSPAGQATADFVLPFSDLELENCLLRLGRPARTVRRLESTEMTTAKSFGAALFNAVFSGDVRACLRSSVDEAKRDNAGIRLRLRLADPALADLPWEFLYVQNVNRFLALSVQTPLVRYMDLPEVMQPIAVTPPIRVLVMISSPTDYPSLDVEGGVAAAQRGARRSDQGRHAVARADGGGDARRAAAAPAPLAVPHLPFHRPRRVRSDAAGRGAAARAGEAARPPRRQPVSRHAAPRPRVAARRRAERLRRRPHLASRIRSPVRRRRWSSRASPRSSPCSSRSPTTWRSTFAHELYGALADGYPIDAAVTEARKAIFAMGREVEWATPVLYLRAPDGRIFDIDRSAAVTPTAGPAQPAAEVTLPHSVIATQIEPLATMTPKEQSLALLRSAGRSLGAGDFAAALDMLEHARALDPSSPALADLTAMAEGQRAVAETRAQRRAEFREHLDVAAGAAVAARPGGGLGTARRGAAAQAGRPGSPGAAGADRSRDGESAAPRRRPPRGRARSS